MDPKAALAHGGPALRRERPSGGLAVGRLGGQRHKLDVPLLPPRPANGVMGPWAMSPWAHGPTGPWAPGPMAPGGQGRACHEPMGPCAHEPMGPWAHGPMGHTSNNEGLEDS